MMRTRVSGPDWPGGRTRGRRTRRQEHRARRRRTGARASGGAGRPESAAHDRRRGRPSAPATTPQPPRSRPRGASPRRSPTTAGGTGRRGDSRGSRSGARARSSSRGRARLRPPHRRRPTTAPLATIARRTWRSVAPSAPSMPSARSRRCAMTAKPAAATRPTNRRPMVSSARTTTAAAVLSNVDAGSDAALSPRSDGTRSTCWPVASKRIVTWVGGLAWPGATSANSSFRSNGFSTSPTTWRRHAVRRRTGRRSCTPKIAAAPSVIAMSPGPVG